jgi:hypothetical protein
VSGAAAALFRVIEALMTGKQVPGESILGIFREVMVLLGRTVGPEVKTWLPHISRLLTLLLPQVIGKRTQMLDQWDVAEDDAPSFTQFGFAMLPAAGAAALPAIVRLVLYALAILGQIFAVDIAGRVVTTFPALKTKVAEAGMAAGEFMLDGMNLLHAPMEGVMRIGSQVLFDRLDQQLSQLGESSPDRVMEMAPELLALAGGLGMSAHLVAVIAEKIAIFKQLGFPQLAAFLVDLADFKGIARNTISVQMEAALRSPALRHARARFRPELPPAFTMDQLWLERAVPEEEARQFYREQGWKEDTITRWLAALFREPAPRELGLLFEDAEVDEFWIQRMLEQSGFDDETVTHLRQSVKIRSQKGLRQALLTEIEASVSAGVIEEGLALEYLAPLRLREDTLQLFFTQARLGRYRRELGEQKTVLEDQAQAGLLTPEDLQAELSALGFDARAQLQAARRARLRVGLRAFREERADIKAAIRRAQSDRVTAALDLHRRFQLSDEDLEQVLIGIGVQEVEVPALVQLAAVRREPVPRLPTVLSPEAKVQAVLEDQADQVLALQGNKVIDEGTAQVLLLALGVDQQTASLKTGLVAARIQRPPVPVKAVAEPAAVREERQLRTDAAVVRFRAGVLSEAELRALLRQLGHPVPVADALVEREVARQAGKVTS